MDLPLAFEPGTATGGALDREKYNRRRDVCTITELERLTASKEFKEWEARKHSELRGNRKITQLLGLSWKPALGVTALLLLLLLGGAPVWNIPESQAGLGEQLTESSTQDVRQTRQDGMEQGLSGKAKPEFERTQHKHALQQSALSQPEKFKADLARSQEQTKSFEEEAAAWRQQSRDQAQLAQRLRLQNRHLSLFRDKSAELLADKQEEDAASLNTPAMTFDSLPGWLITAGVMLGITLGWLMNPMQDAPTAASTVEIADDEDSAQVPSIEQLQLELAAAQAEREASQLPADEAAPRVLQMQDSALECTAWDWEPEEQQRLEAASLLNGPVLCDSPRNLPHRVLAAKDGLGKENAPGQAAQPEGMLQPVGKSPARRPHRLQAAAGRSDLPGVGGRREAELEQEVSTLKEKLEQVSGELRCTADRCEQAESKVEELDTQLARAHADGHFLLDKLTAAERTAAEFEVLAASLEVDVRKLHGKEQRAASSIEQLTVDKSLLESQLQTVREELQMADSVRQLLEDSLTEERHRAAVLKHQLEEAQLEARFQQDRAGDLAQQLELESAAVAGLTAERSPLQEELKGMTHRMELAEAELALSKQVEADLEAERGQLAAQLSEVNSESWGLLRKLDTAEAAQKGLQAKLQLSEDARLELAEQLVVVNRDSARRVAGLTVDELQRMQTQLQGQFERVAQEVASLEKVLQERQAELDERTAENAALVAKVGELEQQLAQKAQAYYDLEQVKAHLEGVVEGKACEMARLGQASYCLEAQVEQVTAQLAETARTKSDLEVQLHKAQQDIDDLAIMVEQRSRDFEALEADHKALLAGQTAATQTGPPADGGPGGDAGAGHAESPEAEPSKSEEFESDFEPDSDYEYDQDFELQEQDDETAIVPAQAPDSNAGDLEQRRGMMAAMGLPRYISHKIAETSKLMAGDDDDGAEAAGNMSPRTNEDASGGERSIPMTPESQTKMADWLMGSALPSIAKACAMMADSNAESPHTPDSVTDLALLPSTSAESEHVAHEVAVWGATQANVREAEERLHKAQAAEEQYEEESAALDAKYDTLQREIEELNAPLQDFMMRRVSAAAALRALGVPVGGDVPLQQAVLHEAPPQLWQAFLAASDTYERYAGQKAAALLELEGLLSTRVALSSRRQMALDESLAAEEQLYEARSALEEAGSSGEPEPVPESESSSSTNIADLSGPATSADDEFEFTGSAEANEARDSEGKGETGDGAGEKAGVEVLAEDAAWREWAADEEERHAGEYRDDEAGVGTEAGEGHVSEEEEEEPIPAAELEVSFSAGEIPSPLMAARASGAQEGTPAGGDEATSATPLSSHPLPFLDTQLSTSSFGDVSSGDNTPLSEAAAAAAMLTPLPHPLAVRAPKQAVSTGAAAADRRPPSVPPSGSRLTTPASAAHLPW